MPETNQAAAYYTTVEDLTTEPDLDARRDEVLEGLLASFAAGTR